MKIGVLVPASRALPELDRDFINGLSAALIQAGVSYELVVESIGNAAVKDAVIDRIQRMLLQHQPDVVTGVLGTAMLRHVEHFFRNSRTPLIVNNFGADPLLNGGLPNAYLFHNSYNVWQSCCALGYWAAKHVGRRAVEAIGFHESGYGIITSFFAGFVAGGGEVVAVEVTHRNSSTEDCTPELQRLAAHEPDLLMGFYSANEAVSFMHCLGASGLMKQIPLLASPAAFFEPWLSRMADEGRGVRTSFSWGMDRNHPEFRSFVGRYASVDSGEPRLFGILGYETGQMLGVSVSAGGLQRNDLAAALTEVEFVSPRGELAMDPVRRTILTDDYLLHATGDVVHNRLNVQSNGRLELPAGYWQAYDEFSRQEVRPGWINPYLVT